MNLFIINFKTLIVKTCLYLIVFLFIGEIISRLDKLFNLSYRNNFFFTNHDIARAFDMNSFPLNYKPTDGQYRIMVIGDSYIKGISINPNHQFSNILLDTLNKIIPTSIKPIVLNLSQSGNDLIGNYLFFEKYIQIFKPHTILWFHNLADLDFIFNGTLVEEQINNIFFNNKDPIEDHTFNSKNYKYKNVKKSLIKKERQTLFNRMSRLPKMFFENSELIKYLKYNVFNELLKLGIRIPSTEFNYLTKYAYKDNSLEFKLFKKIFNEKIPNHNIKSTSIIFYFIPEFNLIHKPKLFHNVEEALKLNFKKQSETVFINGRLKFLRYKSSELTLVSTDSHPNELAHKIISDDIIKLLTKIDFKYLRK